ncbi:MAG: SDR family oxidoreductase [Pseudomonadota bacterium]|jgi:NAD(P)-dependent dehydrogenase (short-subunit alcohol dehydrogenase family)
MSGRPELLLVTGAAGGIGAAIVRAAARAGWAVRAVDLREPDSALRDSAGPAVDWCVADVTSAAGVERAFDCGRTPAAVVNSAGIVQFAKLADLSRDDFVGLLDVNLVGTFLVTQAAVRRLREAGGGAVVNVSSVAAHAPAPGTGAYTASKAGIEAMSRQFAVELAGTAVRVNCVAPGFIDAGMGAANYDRVAWERRAAAVPLRRLGTAEDVADAVLFLVSPASRYVTGQTLVVDGGVLCNTLGLLPRG